MRQLTAIALILLLVLGVPPAAKAQALLPEVISGTVSITAELRAEIEAYLETSPPSVAPFYAPTYAQYEGQYTLVSLAGLNIESPDDPWFMEGRDDQPANVIWTGTVRINADGSGSMHSTPMSMARQLPKLAVPLALPAAGPGGGIYVRLPFQSGKSMQYGPRAVHGSGDYGTSGMLAVDLVGGTNLGANVANSTVFASTAGTVDYVCTDDYQAVIRTYNAATDDYFLYAHLYDNASLELDHVFGSGAVIGSLVPGTFTDDCGWTEQGDQIYHVHWMFEPSASAFKVGAYTITMSDEKFHAGDKVYGTGAWIFNTSTPSGIDDPTPGQAGAAPSFWDTVVGGIVNAAGGVAASLPPPASVTIIHAMSNTASLMFRLMWILVRGNLNLSFTMTILLAVITMRLLFSMPWFVAWVLRVARNLKQLFSPMG